MHLAIEKIVQEWSLTKPKEKGLTRPLMLACLNALSGIAEDGAEGGQDEVVVLVVRALLHEEEHGLEDGGEHLLRAHLPLQDRPDVLEPQFLETIAKNILEFSRNRISRCILS